jgi:hypothetical protein
LSERRQATRILCNLPVRYSSGHVSTSGRVSSLSRTGVYLHTDVIDDTGAGAMLSLSLPGDPDPLELSGTVVRINSEHGPGMGIRFGELAGVVQRRLANFMIERSLQARP